MPAAIPDPDAREVDRVEALVTVDDPGRVDEFLARCQPGSAWLAQIRTAEVTATVRARAPLGSFDERVCLCLSLKLALPVPVEPRLRFVLAAGDDLSLTVTALVRPWSESIRAS
ncbi:hypothetical protein EP7_001641 [Isosphaeraceae bacterium EP7]